MKKLVSVGLSFVLPSIFGWYRIEMSILGTTMGVYITRIGTFASTGGLLSLSVMLIYELIGGILLIIGAIVCIVGAVKESKGAGIVGGILILLGPLLLITDLLLGFSDLTTIIELLGGPAGASVFWGSITLTGPPDVIWSWGIWIGPFIALAGGVLGISGGATL